MKSKYFLAVLLFLTVQAASAQWSLININTGYNLTKVIFINDSVGYIIGDSIYNLDLSGKLFKTIDRGLTWNEVHWYLQSFTDIDFVSADTGFIASTDGINNFTRRTYNGGYSWLNINTNAPNGQEHFTSSLKGFAIKNVGNQTELYTTKDGAINWSPSSIVSSGSAVQDLQFINDSIGFVGGLYAPLMAQYDLSNQQINLIGAQTAAVRKIQFFNKDTGYFAAFDFPTNLTQFYFTTNGGANFGSMFNMAQFGLSLTDEINSFRCYDVDHCLCATSSGNVIFGIGNNIWWKETTPANSISSIWATPDFAIAVGENGTVIRRTYATGIENNLPPDKTILCYPNITTDYVTIKSLTSEKLNVFVFDVNGKLIQQVKDVSKSIQISLLNSASGLYFIVAQRANGNSRSAFKVVKQ